jgi:hypothetical protein
MISYSSSPLQFFSVLLILTGGGILALSVRHYFNSTVSRTLALYSWHTLFCLVYFYYVLTFGGDAKMYFRTSFHQDLVFYFGTGGVRVIVSVLTQWFGLSFLGCSLVFQFFGFVGLMAFDSALREVTWNKERNIRQLATLIVFLPSVSFWSAGLGKDSLSFFAMGLALWAALRLRQRWLLLTVSILVMLLVRPHMAGILTLGLTASFAAQRRIPLFQRIMLGTVALTASLYLVPLGLNYAGVGEGASAAELGDYIDIRQGHNLHGGGAVDISNMSLPIQMFTYLFRPTLIEVRNFVSLAAALDNTVLLFLFIAGGWALIKRPLSPYLSSHNRIFLWVYCTLSWALLAMTTANMGIALRQKWMFAPMLIVLLISVIGRSQTSHAAPVPRVAVPRGVE